MEALQKELVDERRIRLSRHFPQTSVGSSGFTGMAGLTVGGTIAVTFTVPETFPNTPPTDLIYFLATQTETPTPSFSRPVVEGYRSRELEWRKTHKEELQVFAGEWVVLENNAIVAHGRDPIEVVSAARSRGIQTPYVFYVPATDEDVAWIGL